MKKYTVEVMKIRWKREAAVGRVPTFIPTQNLPRKWGLQLRLSDTAPSFTFDWRSLSVAKVQACFARPGCPPVTTMAEPTILLTGLKNRITFLLDTQLDPRIRADSC